MRSIFPILSLSLCLGLNAQTNKALRDSLALAMEELTYRPDSVDLRLKKASWNLELQQWEYALAEYNQVLRLEPGNLAAHFYRAFVYDKLKRYKFARVDYEAVLQAVPGNFEARLGLALVNNKDKHLSKAMDELNALCQYYPDRSEAFAARAGVEEERGLLELAEYDYGEALRLEPDNAGYLLARAELRIKMRRKAGALDDLQRLAALGYPPTELAPLYKRIKKL